MKRFGKRLTALIISATLTMGLFSACTKKSPDNSETGSTTEIMTEARDDSKKNETANSETNVDDKTYTVDFDTYKSVEAVDDEYRNYYEIFVRSFADSNGDKIGDLNGVTAKLNYLADLGVNGIWFMPLCQSTTYHKYDVVDYKSIDKEYGSLSDFDKLIEEAHKRGINVIIDYVINHTSSQHEWFKAACDYLKGLDGKEASVEDNKYFGYYNFSKNKENASYYPVPGTDWYYEGSFWEEMPDLNLKNEALKAEILDIADFWMEHGVDGFRMDAAMHYEENDPETNEAILKELFSYCREKNPKFYMVSEVWANETTVASYYNSKTPSMFNFPVSGAEGILAKAARSKYSGENFVKALLEFQDNYGSKNPDYIDAPFLTNHDQVRIANNLQSEVESLKYAAGLLLSMSGNPFIYYGEEIGMKSAGQKDENKRLPMYWSKNEVDYITNPPAGADTGVEMTLPALDEQLNDENSLVNYYKKALKIRNENPEIARGKISIVDSLTSENVGVTVRSWNEKKLAVIYNTGKEECTIDLASSELKDMEIVDCLTLDNEEIKIVDGKITLPSRSIVYLR